MESNKKRIRKVFEPLTVMSGLVCTSPASPLTQVYNSSTGEYEPNRQLTPTVIHPDVTANARDGSWHTPQANAYLADMVWYVNGKDITKLSEWQGLYEIDLVGATRGDLIIKKNLAPGASLEIHFKAVIADYRLGVNIPIKCDPVIISTVDKSGDEYSMSIGDDQIIKYDPFKDKLAMYLYKVSHGIITGSPAEQAEATDENSFEREIPVQLFKGGKQIEATQLKLFKVTGVVSGVPQYSEIKNTPTESSEELVDITRYSVTLDLRCVEKCDYMIKAYIEQKEVAQKQFSVARVYRKFTVRPTNGTSIAPTDTHRYDVAMVDCDGNTVDCGESIVRIFWKTDSANLTNVFHGEGGDVLINLAKTGIGNTFEDDWLDVYCEGEHKPIHSMAIDESGNELTDENGDTFIFN